MKPHAYLFFVIFVLLVIAIPAQAQTEFDDAWRGIADHFHERAEEEGIVGASLWFVHHGEILAKEFHGFANLEPQRPVDEHTIYHWASITKTFTGIAVMQLRDRNRLKLNDAIVDYLPALKQVHNPYGPMDAITLRHLMSHTAGFRGPTWPWGGDEPWHEHEPTEWSQLVAMMPYTEILFEPGSQWSYSNPGIIFLGEVVERLTGDDYEVYMDKNVLDPLKMYHSYFDVTPYHLIEHRSNNYLITGGDTTANGLDFDTGITTSNGGLNAPVTDMVKYVSFLMGACDDENCANVLDRSSLQEMWEPVIRFTNNDEDETWRDEWEGSIGLTFFIYEKDGRKIIGHTGGQKAFSTFFYVEPKANVAAIAAFNTEGDEKPDIDALFDELQEQLFNRIFPLFVVE